jgi:hypothetical protein
VGRFHTVNVTGTGPDGQQAFTGTFTAKSAKADPSAPSGIALVGDLTGQLTGQPVKPTRAGTWNEGRHQERCRHARRRHQGRL